MIQKERLYERVLNDVHENADELAGGRSDPFEPVITDGKIWGRGTA